MNIWPLDVRFYPVQPHMPCMANPCRNSPDLSIEGLFGFTRTYCALHVPFVRISIGELVSAKRKELDVIWAKLEEDD